MMKKTFLIVVVLLAVAATAAYAGNERRIGTAGALELQIPAGSRGAALGGAVVASAQGVDAIFWNPAGLAWMDGTEAMFTHLPYIADIDVEYAAIGTQIEDFGAIGLSVKVVDVGEIEETTEDFPDGTGREFSPTMAVVGLSYARALTHNINFGASGYLVREDVFEVSATGLSFDFGFTYETGWRGVTLGFAMKNYGPNMSFAGKGFDRLTNDGRPVSSENSSFELPTQLHIGAAWNFLEQDKNAATFSGNFIANNQSQDAWEGGVEYAYDDFVFLRGGYRWADQDGYIYGASLGAGLVVPIGGADFTFEYTWAETDVFDNNQWFTVKAAF